MDVGAESWRANLEPQPFGIYFVPPIDVNVRPPRLVEIDGRPYHRFMDYVLLPEDVEELPPESVRVINALRLRLLTAGLAEPAQMRVKEVISDFLRKREPELLVEWGCGYDPLSWRVPAAGYVGIDLDPEVVRVQNSVGLTCLHPSSPELDEYSERADVMVSVFVFHFRITDEDAATMHRVLRPGAFMLANVYRRDDRGRAELRGLFEAHGLRVAAGTDSQNLCENHEYWVVGKFPSVEDSRRVLAEFLEGAKASDRLQ